MDELTGKFAALRLRCRRKVQKLEVWPLAVDLGQDRIYVHLFDADSGKLILSDACVSFPSHQEIDRVTLSFIERPPDLRAR